MVSLKGVNTFISEQKKEIQQIYKRYSGVIKAAKLIEKHSTAIKIAGVATTAAAAGGGLYYSGALGKISPALGISEVQSTLDPSFLEKALDIISNNPGKIAGTLAFLTFTGVNLSDLIALATYW